jgi:hypothetical protein
MNAPTELLCRDPKRFETVTGVPGYRVRDSLSAEFSRPTKSGSASTINTSFPRYFARLR